MCIRSFILSCSLLVFFGPDNIATAQIRNSYCDTTIRCQDIDLFTLQTVRNSPKRRKLALCLDQNRQARNLTVTDGRYQFTFSVQRNSENIITLTCADSAGSYRHKNLFDTVIIAGNNLFYQRKLKTPEKELVDVKLYIMRVSADGNCHFVAYQPDDKTNIMDYSRNVADDNVFDHFAPVTKSYERTVKLAACNGTFCWEGKSLFWQMIDNFLDFYTHSG